MNRVLSHENIMDIAQTIWKKIAEKWYTR